MRRWFSALRRSSTATPTTSSRSATFFPEHGPSTLPKDHQEIRRLDVQHFYLRHEMRGNYLAPLVAPTAILDIGCGTGRWAMEMAQQFPQAQVMAFDIAPPTPGESLGHGVAVIPPNVEFRVLNATQPLPFADGAFDFVYMRLLYSVMPTQLWEPLIREVVRVSRPGGWVESLEALPFPSSQRIGMATIIDWFSEMLRQRGVDPLVALKMVGFFRDAGLMGVTKYEINQAQRLPEQLEQRRTSGNFLIDNLRTVVVENNIATAIEYERIANLARHELASGEQLSGFNTYVTYGQLPMTAPGKASS